MSSKHFAKCKMKRKSFSKIVVPAHSDFPYFSIRKANFPNNLSTGNAADLKLSHTKSSEIFIYLRHIPSIFPATLSLFSENIYKSRKYEYQISG